jgi:hypothetical protein
MGTEENIRKRIPSLATLSSPHVIQPVAKEYSLPNVELSAEAEKINGMCT